MKIEIEASILSQAVDSAIKVLKADKSWLPAASNKVEIAANESIHVRSFGPDATVRIPVQGHVIEEGSVCVPFDTLKALKAASGTIVVETVSETRTRMNGKKEEEYTFTQVVIREKGGVFKVSAIEEGLPPYVPAKGNPVNISAAEFLDAIGTCVITCSKDEMRRNLQHIDVSHDNQSLAFYSTDGHRLTLMRYTQVDPVAFRVDRRFANVLKDLLYGTVTTYAKKGEVWFVTDNGTELYLRYNTDSFPDAKRVLRDAYKPYEGGWYDTTVDTKMLKEALKKIQPFVDSKSNRVTVTCNDDGVTLLGENDGLSSQRTIPFVKKGIKDTSAGFNILYLLDMLTQIRTPSVRMSMTDALTPGLFHEVEGREMTIIVMPLR